MAQPVLIDGTQGPYTEETAGHYGKNTALRLQRLFVDEQTLLSELVCQYTPAAKKRLDDVFGYAELDLQLLDVNHDGHLDLSDLQAAYQGSPETAEAFLSVLSRDGQSVRVVDLAAYLLFQDAPAQSLLDAVAGFEETGHLSPEHANELRESLAALFPNVRPQAADGAITPDDRKLADFAILNLPFIARSAIEGIRNALQLDAAYNRYQGK